MTDLQGINSLFDNREKLSNPPTLTVTVTFERERERESPERGAGGGKGISKNDARQKGM
jgi:hypothetical protein